MATIIGQITKRGSNSIVSLGISAIQSNKNLTEWRAKIIRDRFVKNGLKPKAEPSIKDIVNPNRIPHLAIVGSTSRSYLSPISTEFTIVNEANRLGADRSHMTIAGAYHSMYRPLNRSLDYRYVDVSKDNYDHSKIPLWQSYRLSHRKDVGVYIINRTISPYQVLKIQNRPSQLEVQPETSWAVVKSMGRNNPFYQYTGSEDTISFDVSWYCNDPNNRDEVLLKCRLLESWSKSNGYLSSPPILELLFGNSSDNDIFKGYKFILFSASYTLKDMAIDIRDNHQGNMIIGDHIYPMTAVQSLVFKRVNNINTTSEQIISSDGISRLKLNNQNIG